METLKIPKELKNYVRNKAEFYFDKYQVNSIGIGKKNQQGNQPAVIFSVAEKYGLETLNEKNIDVIPATIEVEGVRYHTDVVERTYELGALRVKIEDKIVAARNRKSFSNPISPGVSISHYLGSAGTFGCVVYDAMTSEQYILSNWHVFHGENGQIGDAIVQPGPYDDNRVEENIAGYLVRSYLGIAGDCAIAKIDNRVVDQRILGLEEVFVEYIGEPHYGDMVVKSGRTTNVTYGTVSQVNMVVRMNYGSLYNPYFVSVGSFEITPNAIYPPVDGEISKGGDSGSCWMYCNEHYEPTNLMLGLHYAGETNDEEEYALACYPASVFEKLEILPSPGSQLESFRTYIGFDEDFLSERIFMPKPLSSEISNDFYVHGTSERIDYMHFSLAMSKSRKIARWVAWNVDGNSFQPIRGNTRLFARDQRLPSDLQVGNELYAGNELDRGHIARRADLVWGTYEEAEQANIESYNYTNIAPQHRLFNRSSAGGIWGEIENAIYNDLAKPGSRYSVIAGPVFNDDDKIINNIQIPNSYWKIVYYQDKLSHNLVSRAYIVTQIDLVQGMDASAESLDDYQVYQLPINSIQSITELDFPNKAEDIGSLETASNESQIKLISSINEITSN